MSLKENASPPSPESRGAAEKPLARHIPETEKHTAAVPPAPATRDRALEEDARARARESEERAEERARREDERLTLALERCCACCGCRSIQDNGVCSRCGATKPPPRPTPKVTPWWERADEVLE